MTIDDVPMFTHYMIAAVLTLLAIAYVKSW